MLSWVENGIFIILGPEFKDMMAIHVDLDETATLGSTLFANSTIFVFSA